jgi:5S rRNA maturation endonuclease (ribonuclease M5)
VVSFRPCDLPPEFFLIAAHRERWEARKDKQRATSYDTWRVVSVEESDRIEEVFCATVDGSHAFALEDNILTGNCKAGCESADILAKLGLTWETLCSPREDESRGEWTPNGEAIAIYDYRDEAGKLLFQVCRTADKKFSQRVPDATRKSGYRWSLEDTRRVLYRLPKVVEAVKDGEIIYVVEGEKDVHSLERIGIVATCNSGGTGGGWRDEYSDALRGAVVMIIADKDKSGQAHARKVMASLKGIAAAIEIHEAAGDLKDVTEHLAAGHTLADLELTCREEDYKPDLAPDLYEFLAVVDPPSDWVIPGLLERSDRLIWTGFEGQGKSVVIRQLAVCAAAGMHPFTREPITPQRVLFIDCENPDRKSRRHFRKLEAIARANGFPVPEGALRILQRPEGIDLTREEDAAWLLERVTAHQPSLLTCGPFYRLHAADTNEESAARTVVSALDAARIKVDCALVTEAHAGHGDGANRSVRPTGSSLLMRWPEFGYGIKPIGEADENGRSRHVAVLPWRGPREERHWPRELIWGTHELDWPWVSADHLNLPSL